MTELPRRPIVIWIAQIVVLVMGVPLLLISLFTLARDSVFLSESDLSFQLVLAFFVSSALRIGFIVFFFFAFWGMQKRRSYGRWLGVGAIGLLILLSIAGQFLRPSGPVGYYEYKNDAERVGAVFGQLIIYGLLSFFLYRLAFSKKVNEFFNPPERIEESLPPGPETYLGP